MRHASKTKSRSTTRSPQRRSVPRVLLLVGIASSVPGVGCRQPMTTGSTLQPFATTGGTGPALAPFPGAGSPRVTPPQTGSAGTPGATFGGVQSVPVQTGIAGPPISAISPGGFDPTASIGFDPIASTTSPWQSEVAIGSGVAQVDWQSPAGPEPSAASPSPRLGGMRVNDLTQAPPPPGYPIAGSAVTSMAQPTIGSTTANESIYMTPISQTNMPGTGMPTTRENVFPSTAPPQTRSPQRATWSPDATTAERSAAPLQWRRPGSESF